MRGENIDKEFYFIFYCKVDQEMGNGFSDRVENVRCLPKKIPDVYTYKVKPFPVFLFLGRGTSPKCYTMHPHGIRVNHQFGGSNHVPLFLS